VSQLPYLHTTFGPEYYERLIQPEVRSAAREVVGRYTPEELYSTRRTELQQQIEQRVSRAAENQFVDVEAILIRDVALPDQIRQAIELKLQEEQRVQQLTFTIERERREAERKRIEAEGQAAYQQLITSTLTPQFLQYQGIQATQALAESDNAKVVIIGGDGSGLPVILGDQ
jgi:regulator of protease activity HflC (stomatin/prohibitin superfamily)